MKNFSVKDLKIIFMDNKNSNNNINNYNYSYNSSEDINSQFNLTNINENPKEINDFSLDLNSPTNNLNCIFSHKNEECKNFTQNKIIFSNFTENTNFQKNLKNTENFNNLIPESDNLKSTKMIKLESNVKKKFNKKRKEEEEVK